MSTVWFCYVKICQISVLRSKFVKILFFLIKICKIFGFSDQNLSKFVKILVFSDENLSEFWFFWSKFVS